MKRKRGPAPRGNKRKQKRVAVEQQRKQESESESDYEIEDDEESFQGFSSPEGEATKEVDKEVSKRTATSGGSEHTKRKGEKPAPTKEELMDLFLRSSSFQSNLFKLQTEELLSEVRLKYGRMTKVETALHQVKDVIMAIPESNEQLLHDFETDMKTRHKIVVPFPTPAPPKDALHKFKFQAPASVKLVGSYPLKATSNTSNGFVIDVAVTMPDDIFQDKDFLDHRYFYKRACYLASLAAGLRTSNLPVSLTFELVDDDQRKPCLVLSPIEDGTDSDFSKSRARIRILPAISHNLFPASKLLYTQSKGENGNPVYNVRCNIRTASDTPTPLYNNAILADSTHIHFLTQIYNASQACPAVIDAVLLGNQWLRQRGFSGSFGRGGFGSFEWTWFVSYLLRGGGPNGRNVLEPAFSSFQLFRGALNSLALKDRINAGVVEGLDESGVNVFYKMTSVSYKLLQHEARRTLSILNEGGDDVFNAIFTAKVDVPVLRFDLAATIAIPLDEVKHNVDSPSASFSCIQRTASLLQQALTDRITHLSVTTSSFIAHPISTRHPPESPLLTLGLLLDPEKSRRSVDYGHPSNNDDDTNSFTNLWGSKAATRRVKDGRILQAVVWDCKCTEEQYGIVKRIIKYILALHISAGVAGDVHFLTPTFFPLLSPPNEVISTFSKTDGDAFLILNQAYESFVRQLRDLRDMPLNISSVIPVSTALIHTSVYPPYPQNFLKLAGQFSESYYIPSQEVIALLEGSGKWPDDLRAIQKVKMGFLLQIARELDKHAGVTTHVGLENPDADISNTGFLDVVYEGGYAFRVRLQHDPNHREATLIERILKNKSLAPRDRMRFEGALKRYRDNFVYGVAHAQALRALRGKFYFLPHTIRLVKRWFAAHLLSPHVSDRVIELIVCSLFLRPQPFVGPASAEVGFLRMLKFLASWDWKKDPLVVNLDESMTNQKYEEINKAFEVMRKQDPAAAHSACAIYPSYETSGSLWTKDKPGKAVAARITALAKSSLQVISKGSGGVKQIFTTPFTDYDFVIHLKRNIANEVKGFKNLRGQNWKDVFVGFDPYGAYLKELESCFGDAILWFYDNVTGSVIAGLWNPHVAATRPWKIALGYSSTPIGESKDNKPPVVLNKEAVLAEIVRLGTGLISSIDTKH